VVSSAPSSEIVAAVTAVQGMLAADGALIEFESYEAGALCLRLVVEDAECAECIVPAELLEQIALTVARRSVPEVERVVVLDPRA
jgi:hypothetical protein